MIRCKSDEDLVKKAATLLGVSTQAIRAGAKVDKWSFCTSFPMTGDSYSLYVDDYSLKLVEEGKISPFKGGWSLP